MKFTFWKENRLDQEYILTIDEIKDKYKIYLSKKKKSWVEHYNHQTVISFVGDNEGLNSVTDEENYNPLQKELKDIRNLFLKNKNK